VKSGLGIQADQLSDIDQMPQLSVTFESGSVDDNL